MQTERVYQIAENVSNLKRTMHDILATTSPATGLMGLHPAIKGSSEYDGL